LVVKRVFLSPLGCPPPAPANDEPAPVREAAE
jgi:hypothetical protein